MQMLAVDGPARAAGTQASASTGVQPVAIGDVMLQK